MNDDVLRRAARALRERESGEPLAHRATKDEVLRALAPSPSAPASRRARRPFFALAAALVLSTAWAASAGHLPSLRHAVAVAFGPPPEPTTLTPERSEPPPNSYAARAAASARSDAPSPNAPDAPDANNPTNATDVVSSQAAPHEQAPAPAPIARETTNEPLPGPGEWFAPSPPPPTTPTPTSPSTPPAPTSPSPTASPRAPTSARALRPSRANPATSAPAPVAAPSAGPNDGAAPSADDLYERAHRAHFGGRDPAAALAAWNAYLAAAPRGRFALEARYNRALTLVRLGRRDEAARALEPFAAGDFGGYRQNEAKRLLPSLRAAD
ncbi:MAG: hypothetical protein MUF34_32580 [Polyangiaceae bacterium]|jgi:hypothetical protein|nr:hypothetical protein [Polyangiaceae bacterium]